MLMSFRSVMRRPSRRCCGCCGGGDCCGWVCGVDGVSGAGDSATCVVGWSGVVEPLAVRAGAWRLLFVGIGVLEHESYSLYGFSPIATMLHATIGWIRKVRARAMSSLLSAPGLSHTSGIPFCATSAITCSPTVGGT